MKNKLTFAALSTTVLLTGCANTLEQEVLSSQSIDRRVVGQVLTITPTMGSIRPDMSIASSVVALKVEETTTEEVVTSTVTTTTDVKTPYSGARELYEIPVGLFAVAGGIVINVVDFALLGLVPEQAYRQAP